MKTLQGNKTDDGGEPKGSRTSNMRRFQMKSLTVFWMSVVLVIGMVSGAAGQNAGSGNDPSPNSSAQKVGSIVIGENASVGLPNNYDPDDHWARSFKSIAIGVDANARGYDSIALGTGAKTDAGLGSYDLPVGGVAVGAFAKAYGGYSIAIGYNASANTEYDSPSVHPYAMAIGPFAGAYANETTAVGPAAHAGDKEATAVGYSARATDEFSTAVGSRSRAEHEATALGYFANASGYSAAAVGKHALAGGDYSVAVGLYSRVYALGEDSVAIGSGTVVGGGNSVAIGADAAAGMSGPYEDTNNNPVHSVSKILFGSGWGGWDAFLANGGALTVNATALGVRAWGGGDNSTALGQASVAGPFTSNATAVGQGAHAVADNATALGKSAYAYEYDSLALGHLANAAREGAIAIGAGANATGTDSIAIGRGVSVTGNNQIRIGDSSFTDVQIGAYDLGELATAGNANPALVRAIVANQVADGGAIDVAIDAALNAEISARANADSELRADLGRSTDERSANGTAFARISDAYERISDVESVISSANSAELAAMNVRRLYEMTNAVDPVMPNAEASVITVNSETSEINLRGANMREQLESLLIALTRPGGPLVDADGNPVNTTLEEFNDLDTATAGMSANQRLTYLFRALYGDPSVTNPAGDSIDTDTPHADSIVGRTQQGVLRSTADVTARRDTNGALQGNGGYREAPVIGSRMDAPGTDAGRRLVVQDTNTDGTVRLSTLPLDTLSSLDGRVDGLEKKLASGIAMSMAQQFIAVDKDRRARLGLTSSGYRGEYGIGVSAGVRLTDKIQLHMSGAADTGFDEKGFKMGVDFQFGGTGGK